VALKPAEGRKEAEARAAAAATWVVISETTGRPCNTFTFSRDWLRIAGAADVPADLQFGNLRAIALTELSNSGADPLHLRTHGGHDTLRVQARDLRPTIEQFQTAAAKRLRARGGRRGEREA
jgi:hypothetical protein